jgi:hypothetical protein
MPDIANITVTGPATLSLYREVASTRVVENHVLALTYLAYVRNPDGTSIAGFRPGYMVSGYPAAYLRGDTPRVHLPDGLVFYLLRSFGWRPDRLYRIDVVDSCYTVFSIDEV